MGLSLVAEKFVTKNKLMLRPDLAPLDRYLADAISLDDASFMARHRHAMLIVASPQKQKLRHPRGPNTVIEPAPPLPAAISRLHPSWRGASLDSVCLELRGATEMTNRIAVGRSPEADVVLLDASVSRFHAELRWSAGFESFQLKDLGSRNGSYCNGQLLPKNGSVTLHSGVALGFGSVSARIYNPKAFMIWLREGAPKAGAAPGEWPRFSR